MRLGVTGILALCGVLVSGRAGAQGVPAGGTPPSAAVPVRVVPGKIRPVYQHSSAAFAAAPYPSASVELGAQAAKAFAVASARALGGAGGRLELRIAPRDADVVLEPDGWIATVEHEVVLVAEPSTELGRWRVRGDAAVEGGGETALPRAFERAATVVAERWEAQVGESAPVAAWFTERGLPPPPRRAPPVVPPRSKELVRSPWTRATWVGYLDASVSVGWASDPVLRSETAASGGFALRAGVSGPLAMASLGLASPGAALGDATMLGADLGAVLRVRSSIELRGGGGLYWADGLAPSVFAGVHVVTGLRGPRASMLRVGAEGRYWVGTGDAAFPPGGTLSLVFGLENALPP